jgi:hypothetical protein
MTFKETATVREIAIFYGFNFSTLSYRINKLKLIPVAKASRNRSIYKVSDILESGAIDAPRYTHKTLDDNIDEFVKCTLDELSPKAWELINFHKILIGVSNANN